MSGRRFRQEQEGSRTGRSPRRLCPSQGGPVGQGLMKPLIVPFFISNQGCPHRCIFCNQVKIAGGGGLPSVNDLLDRIAACRVTAGGRPMEVAFYGGTFTSLPESE